MVKLTSAISLYLQENFYLAHKTKDGKRRAFRYLVEVLGDKLINSLTLDHCEHYKRYLLVGRGLAKSSANIMMRDVGSVLQWAVEVKKLMPENPMAKVKQFKVGQNKIHIWESEHFWQMMEYASPIWQIRLLLGRCGLRRGAVLNITRDNIRDGYIFVEPKRETETTWPWAAKDHECRAIPMPDSFDDYLALTACYYPAVSVRVYENSLRLQKRGLLTETRRKTPDQNFNRDFRDLQMAAFGKLAGSFHDLRRTFITAALEGHIPLHVVKALSGHSKTETLMTYYTAVRESMLESARGILNNSIKKGCRMTTKSADSPGGLQVEPTI